MKHEEQSFRIIDILLLIMTILPLACGVVLYVLFTGVSEDIEISGAGIYFTIKMPFQNLPITESQVNSWLVIISVFFLCLYLTHGLSVTNPTRRQHIVELAVEQSRIQQQIGGIWMEQMMSV
ncbi:MAG: hypothetical protein IIT42_04720 [Clostridia bacterium]|nr:hypothetical protein [Clostridia bacterium]